MWVWGTASLDHGFAERMVHVAALTLGRGHTACTKVLRPGGRETRASLGGYRKQAARRSQHRKSCRSSEFCFCQRLPMLQSDFLALSLKEVWPRGTGLFRRGWAAAPPLDHWELTLKALPEASLALPGKAQAVEGGRQHHPGPSRHTHLGE